MSLVKRGKGRPPFPAKVMLSLSPETYARLQREAEETQSTVAGVARSMIARLLAQDATRGSGERRSAVSPAEEMRAA